MRGEVDLPMMPESAVVEAGAGVETGTGEGEPGKRLGSKSSIKTCSSLLSTFGRIAVH
jgi:hypothetical protein